MSASLPRLKIITIGFNTRGTGLTRVMHSIMRRLADRHEIHYLGIGYSGEPEQDRGLTCHPTNLKGGDVFAAFQAKRLIEEIHPDLVFILHDIWMFEYYLRILGPFREQLKIACYIPIDGKITKEAEARHLSQADSVIAYTEFARQQFEQAFARLRAQDSAVDFPVVEVIPHGVDGERFFPFPELLQNEFASASRLPAKQQVFPELPQAEDSFVVLNASRPDRRKRIDLTIAGFAAFAADKPANVRLCLHHAIMGEEEEQQIQTLVQQYGLGERLLLNPLGRGIASDERLNLLYNACDVGINTSMGEGWGLVSFEHGAAGAAQIVPDHTACGDLWQGRAELIPPVRSFIPHHSVLEMSEVSAAGVADALESLYRNPQHRQTLSRAAYDAARNPAYSWDAIALQFEALFLRLTRQMTTENAE